MRTAYAEWWHDGQGWKRYGTDRDPIVFVPKDAQPGSLACGYVYADTTTEAIRIDAEVFKPMTRKVKPMYASIGTVSEGTLRDEDLISAFAAELDYYLKRLHLSRDQRTRFARLIRDAADWQDIEMGNNPRWALRKPIMHSERASDIIEELTEALNEIAPPYCYFGTVEGDGACFGFWPEVDNDLPRLTAGDPIPREHWGEDVLLVNDHGNVDCGHVDKRGRFKAYWSVV